MLQLTLALTIIGNLRSSQSLEIYPARSITILEGKTLMMTCVSEQDQDLIWTHNKEQISNEEEQRVVSQNDLYTSELLFKSISKNDKGDYTCTAASANTTRRINIIPKVNFRGTPNQITSIAGEMANLTCTVKVPTTPNKIFWSSEKGVIQNDTKYKVDHNLPETISVRNTSVKDEGIYTCLVSHTTPDGSIVQNTTTFLKVLS